MTLGQRIQELRKQAGLSQEGLGEALGVSRQAVSKWEGDNGIPELDTLIAMSKLFGVSLGGLLGVEEPPQTEEEPTGQGLDEERVEAILRRYVEESRQSEPKKRRIGWLWPLAACCLLLVLVIVLFVRIGDLNDTVSNLRGQLFSLDSGLANVRNEMSGISSQIHNQISSALEEGNNLISTFDYEVYGFDLKAETVDIRLSATLKEYTAGSQLQFVLNWKKTDETEGQTVTELVNGPEFTAEVTIPMNFHLEVSIREALPDGGHREQKVDTVFNGMHPDNFSFDVGGIFDPLALKRMGWYGIEWIKGAGWICIYGDVPDMLWPVSVSARYVLTNPKSEDEKTEETFDLELAEAKDGLWYYRYSGVQDWFVPNGARFEATVTIVDNLGRTFTFSDSAFVDAKGEWSKKGPGGVIVGQDPVVSWPDEE